jgi:hypothetical protein
VCKFVGKKTCFKTCNRSCFLFLQACPVSCLKNGLKKNLSCFLFIFRAKFQNSCFLSCPVNRMPRPALDLDCSTVTPVDLGEDIWGQIRNQRVLISRYRNYQKKIVTLTSISGSSLSSICKHSIVTSGRGRRLLFFCTLLVSSECLSSSNTFGDIRPIYRAQHLSSKCLSSSDTFRFFSPLGPIELWHFPFFHPWGLSSSDIFHFFQFMGPIECHTSTFSALGLSSVHFSRVFSPNERQLICLWAHDGCRRLLWCGYLLIEFY